MRSLRHIVRFTSRSLGVVTPIIGALLLQGTACTIDSPDSDDTSSESSESSAPNLPSGLPSSQGPTPSSAPGSNPSLPQPGTNPSSSAPQNPDPGTSSSSTNSSQEPGEEPEPDPGECFDGEVDLNCHAHEDGTPIVFPSGVPMGNCKAGTRECVDKRWGPCKGAIAPEPEDNCEVINDDATCDGVPNAGCDCLPGETRECGVSNVGACKMGKQRCVKGKWDEACEGAIYPTPEQCDGKAIDEDCNGKTDLEDDQCECLNDTTDYCERTKQKGDCKWGKRNCSEGSWSKCEAWAKPETEVCGSRPDVAGIIWTGDEDCDGGIDTSKVGKPGPKGCVKMMLDQDKDGYGKIGLDLSDLRPKGSLERLSTACLCPNRPDIAEKRREGWVERDFKANRDCGDCAAPLDRAGRDVFPGNNATTTSSNACLRHVGWTLGVGSRDPGDFDLNCDRRHTDPSDRGDLQVIRCRKSGDFSCREVGAGRLILPRNEERLTCGRSYDFGQCYAIIEESYDPNADLSSTVDDGSTFSPGGSSSFLPGDSSFLPGSSTFDDGSSTFDDTKPKKKFKGCAVRKTGGRHLIRCQ